MGTPWHLGPRASMDGREPHLADGLEARLSRGWSLVRVVWTGRWLLLGGMILGLVAMAVYSAISPPLPIYESTARVFVRPIRGIAKEQAPNIGASAIQAAHTEAALLTSTTLLSQTLNHADVRELREVRRHADRVGYLRNTLDVSVGRDDGFITIAARMPTPTEASRLVNALVDTYLAYHNELNHTTTKDVLGVLGAERAHLEQTLAEQKDELESRRSESGLLGLPGDELDLLRQSMVINTTEYTELVRMTELATQDAETARGFESDPEALGRFLSERSAVSSMASTDEFQRDREIEQLRRRRAMLLRRYGPQAPVIVEIDRQIEELSITAPVARPDAEAEIAQLEERQRVLELRKRRAAERVVQQQLRLRELQDAQATIDAAERDIAQTQQMLTEVMVRVQWAELNNAAPPLKIAVLDRATPATQPVAGMHGKRLLEGAVLGLIIGLALVAAYAVVRRRLGSAHEIAEVLGAPVIGVLPKIEENLTDQARGQYVLARGQSRYAEACRAVRTALLFADQRKRGAALAITSPVPGMGKSTVTANLAVCIAQTGRRTLVLDADLRRPRQHKFFGIETDRSIADVLRDSRQMNFGELVHRTSVVGLDVMVCGSPAAHPSEIMTSRIFADAFDALRNQYDIVLIDCPPLLRVTDAQVAAALADQTICVLASDTLARLVSQSRRALEAVGAEVVGAVINGTPVHHPWLERLGGFDRYGAPSYGYPDSTDTKDAA